MAEAGTVEKPKVTLYWLNQSRAQRIVFALEELNVDYEIKVYKRRPDFLAPDELKEIHPLGKSPVISVQGPNGAKPVVIAESAAIVEYLIDHFGKSLIPTRYPPGQEGQLGAETEEWIRWRYYMHYAEGSLMALLMVCLFIDRIRNAPVPFFIKPITRSVAARVDDSYLNANIKTQFGFLEQQLTSSPQNGEFFAGTAFTGADVMMYFPLEASVKRVGVTKEKYPKITAYIERIQTRPAYQRAIKRIEEVTGEPFKAVL